MLTRSQHKLLIFIHNFIQTSGISPSYEEMARALELKSRSGVHRLVDCLIERGFVTRIKDRARAIEVIKLPADVSLDEKVNAMKVLGLSGVKFLINPVVPEGEVWLNHSLGTQRFAVGQ